MFDGLALPGRPGGGVPSLSDEARGLGLAAYTVWPGYGFAFDAVRRQMTRGIATHTGVWPPFAQAVPTRYGYGVTGNYSQWAVQAGGSASQASHSVEAVVFAAAAPQAKASQFCGRGANGGVRLGKTSGGVFYAEIYDTAWRVATGTTAITSGALYVVHGVLCGAVLRLYVNGREEASVAVPTTPGFFSADFRAPLGGDYDVNLRLLAAGTTNNIAWSPGQVMARARAPWSVLRWPDPNRDAVAALLGALPPISAEFAATFPAPSFTAAGSLEIAGSLSAPFPAPSFTAAGVVTTPGITASRTLRLPSRSRGAALIARDRALVLPARSRTVTLPPERT